MSIRTLLAALFLVCFSTSASGENRICHSSVNNDELSALCDEVLLQSDATVSSLAVETIHAAKNGEMDFHGSLCTGSTGVDASTLRELIVLASELVPAPARLKLSDLRIKGPLELSGVVVPFRIEFDKAIFCGDLRLAGATLRDGMELSQSIVLLDSSSASPGFIDGQNVHVTGELGLIDSVFGAALFRSGNLDGELNLSGSLFGHLSFQGGEAEQLVLTNAHQRTAIAEELQNQISDSSESEVEWRERLSGYPTAFIASTLHLSDLRLAELLVAYGLQAEGALLLNDASMRELRLRTAALGTLDFRGLSVAQDVRMYGVQISPQPELPYHADCDPEIPHFQIGVLSLDGAQIGRDLLLSEWTVGDRSNRATSSKVLCLSWMNVGGSVDLSGLTSFGVTLENSIVGRDLIFGSESGANFDVESSLELSGLSISRLVINRAFCFPESIDFEGAVVPLLTINDVQNQSADIVATMSEVPNSSSKANALFVLETSFRTNGSTAIADDIAMAREVVLTNTMSWYSQIPRWVAYVIGGHGYRPNYTLVWLFVLTALGAVISLNATESRDYLVRQSLSVSSQNLRAQRRRWNWFDALVFSFDRLVPLVSINENSKKVQFLEQPWVRAYFVFHAICGYLLAATAFSVATNSIGLLSK